MKKLLKSILIATASIGTIAGSVSAVVSCGEKGPDTPPSTKTPAELLKEDADKMEAKLRTYTTNAPLVIDSKMADGITTGGYTSTNLTTYISQLLAKTPKDYPNTSLLHLVTTLATSSTFPNVNTTMSSAVSVNLSITLESKTDKSITHTIASVPVGVKVTFHTVTEDVQSFKDKILSLVNTATSGTATIPLIPNTTQLHGTFYTEVGYYIGLGLSLGLNPDDFPAIKLKNVLAAILAVDGASLPVAQYDDQGKADAATKKWQAIISIKSSDDTKELISLPSQTTPKTSLHISLINLLPTIGAQTPIETKITTLSYSITIA